MNREMVEGGEVLVASRPTVAKPSLEPIELLELWKQSKRRKAKPKGLIEEGKEWREKRNARWSAVAKFGFAVPTRQALATIAKLAPVVEMGAGRGYWAKLLRDRGVEITAFDKAPGKDPNLGKRGEMWTEVEVGTPERLEDFAGHTLLLIWPPHYSRRGACMATHCLEHWQGEYLVYIGESQGGCTASYEFFERIDEEFRVVKQVRIPNWNGVYDDLVVYQRKKRPKRRTIARVD